MSERPVEPTADTIAKQRRAALPSASVWVEANAGSGKTHVLTNRVLRLLLSGVAPENILCLTYTKAAAANMRARVAERLAEWALMEDEKLRATLIDLEETTPDADKLRLARTLFARALETPGGLKINTIHAFCEAVLHRFPLEARVPFDFAVIEDAEQAELIREAREAVLAEGLDQDVLQSGAVETLFSLMSDKVIEDAISAALADGRNLRAVLADPDAAKARLRMLIGLTEVVGDKPLRRQIVSDTLLTADVLRELVQCLGGDATKSRRFADRLAQINPASPKPALLLSAFFTKDGKGERRKQLLTKSDAAAHPHLAAICEQEAQRLLALTERLTAETLLARSEALIDVLGAIVARYEVKKRARSLLDFDDLIDRLATLLDTEGVMDWVRYKLDAAITHVLVDESQDTNPQQWAVVRKLSEEFFAGESAIDRPRTLFAVGDQKQSIFSFQGAEPRLFVETGRDLGLKARQADRQWHGLTLTASFRTQGGILSAVDKTFAHQDRARAVLETEGVLHESARADQGGSVTLWPPIAEVEVPESSDWPLPADIGAIQSAPRRLATDIAATIKHWIDDERPLGARGRAVVADDIMILVQSRGALFQEIIRALKTAGIESPGADRLPVTNHIAVLDLLALADVLLNPADDLQLAALLRSPLFDVTEEELFLIAHDRPASLWQSIRQSPIASAKSAYEQLTAWRSRLDFGRPYEFFAQILFAQGGLKRFHARLGEEVDDVIAEFLDLALDFEREPDLSLQGFLASLRAADISIKRELPERGTGVRVMTVHGAKGLEAPIVFIADATSMPEASTLRKPLYLVSAESGGPTLIHAPSREQHVPQTMELREEDEARQRDEYWRKLYVAMTRAEDELYVAGTLDRRPGDPAKKLQGSWYEAIRSSLADDGVPIAIEGLEGEGLRYPRIQPAPRPIESAPSAPAAGKAMVLPQVAPPQRSRTTIRPSSAAPHLPLEDALATEAETLRDADLARREGIALHALLQHLARVPSEHRDAVATRALEALLPGDLQSHQWLIAKARSLFARPELAEIFGPDSRAEVPILAHGTHNGEPIRIAGRIDRLLVTSERVLIVDFKSDAKPPEQVADVSAAYKAQLALYALVLKKLFPGRPIGAALLWTESEKLMAIPQMELTGICKDYTLG